MSLTLKWKTSSPFQIYAQVQHRRQGFRRNMKLSIKIHCSSLSAHCSWSHFWVMAGWRGCVKGPVWASLLHSPLIKGKQNNKKPQQRKKKCDWDCVSRTFSKGCEWASHSPMSKTASLHLRWLITASSHPSMAEAAGEWCDPTVCTQAPLLSMPGPRQHFLHNSFSFQQQ